MPKMRKLSSLILAILFLSTPLIAREDPGYKGKKIGPSKVGLRACKFSTSSVDLNINNVRARLLGGGDMWWDLTQARYIVPNVDPASGKLAVSALFAGGVWIGGFDEGNNLKMAAVTYRSSTNNDYWPGPIRQDGTTTEAVCQDWDKHFQVFGSDIDKFIAAYKQGLDPVTGESSITEEQIPEAIKGWPSRNNVFFEAVHGFELPSDNNGLAGFKDRNNNFDYEPLDGDYPVIEIRGCELEDYPDQMVFWIYNDEGAGGAHTTTNASSIGMEVQVQSFAYTSTDELNDMTFYRYKLINRAIEPIDSCFFAMWADPDLGCADDDYIGCDVGRSLMFIYNEDGIDGTAGANCSGNIPTYAANIPLLGIDYFRGPTDENGKEIGMSSFTYYNNSIGNNPPGTEDPTSGPEYYRYLSGSWRDGTPIRRGGLGYSPIGSGPTTKYAFPDQPNSNDPNAWSMCTENLGQGDRRTIQASGPFRLDPGAKNELIIGVPFVPDVQHPCPDIERLLIADDLSQALFDNCFKVTRGPDAPDIDFIELENELVIILSNDPASNNPTERFTATDLKAPLVGGDTLYRFEGYKIYQLKNEQVTNKDFEDPEKAQLIAQVDVENGVTTIFNWTKQPISNSVPSGSVWIPTLKVKGEDRGIRHTFSVKEDAFAVGERRLVNHKKYYFAAVAYAFNTYPNLPFDPSTGVGQRNGYLPSFRNIFTRTGIPRPITDRDQNAQYGTEPIISRLDGGGANSTFLQISEVERTALYDDAAKTEIEYIPGAGPLNVKVYNPLFNKAGEFVLTFRDSIMSDEILEADASWVLYKVGTTDKDTVLSASTLDRLNEQVIANYGFSVTLKQTPDAGQTKDAKNGFIGSSLTYASESGPAWLAFVPQDDNNDYLNFMHNESEGSQFFDLDPFQAYGKAEDIQVFPYRLCDFVDSVRNQQGILEGGLITPAWVNNNNNNVIAAPTSPLARLNNVDIVFTKDKSKWSRCVVVESSTPALVTLSTEFTLDNVKQFQKRKTPSISKDADVNGNPIPDGSTSPGFGWFPGYAVDVETGQRVNIFFGESSLYRDGLGLSNLMEEKNGADMIFNPSSQVVMQGAPLPYLLVFGGRHVMYVTDEPYDECAALGKSFEANPSAQYIAPLRKITWTAMPYASTDIKLLSYADGLIPNDCLLSMRVDNPYFVSKKDKEYDTNPDQSVITNQKRTDIFRGYPSYKIKFADSLAVADLTQNLKEDNLSQVRAVPNPYYAYSAYETAPLRGLVKITNLPAKCNVSIYTLDGRFVRQYRRNESEVEVNSASRPLKTLQIYPDIEWDLRNDKGIPVGSGVYLIHIEVPGVGDKTIKWFGVTREFDPAGL